MGVPSLLKLPESEICSTVQFAGSGTVNVDVLIRINSADKSAFNRLWNHSSVV